MAIDFNEVKYIFTGDTSSLSEATSKAIGLLDEYGNAIGKVAGRSSSISKIGSEIGKVTSRISALKNASQKANQQMGSVGKNFNLNTAKKQIAAMAVAMNTRFATMTQSFAPLVSKMQSLKTIAANTFSRMSKMLGSVSAAFRRVAKSADTDSNSQSRNNKIVQAGINLKNNLARVSNKLSTALQKVSSNSKNVSSGFNSIVAQGVGVKSLFTFLTGMELGKAFTTGIREALHYVEVLNMFQTVLDDSADAGREFVSAMQEMYGLDPTTIMEATSMFYQLASAVETPVESARTMALGLTTITTDIASLFDVDFNKVAADLASGMQGMTRAVRKYGIDIRMATLETTAASLGLKIQADTTSEANRQALRYITIVRQARAASGDFAKTIESPANQLRILREQFQQLARAIGNIFLPVIAKVLPYLNGIVMAIRSIIQFFGKLIGVKDIEFGGATDSAKDLGASMGDAGTAIDNNTKKAKKLKKELTAGIDELNILNEDKGNTGASGGGAGGGAGGDLLDPALAKALEDLDVQLQEVRMKANDVRDAILEFLGFSWDKEGNLTFDASQLETNLINKFPSWTKTITAVFDNWQGIADGVKAVWDALGTSIKSVFQGISQGFTNMIQAMKLDELVASWIESLPDRLQAIADWLNNNQQLFVTMGEIISYVGTAFAAWKVISTILGPLIQIIGVFTKMNPILLAIVAGITLLVAGFIEAYKNSEAFRNAVDKLKADVGTMIGAVIEMIGELWDTFSPTFKAIGEVLIDLWNDTISVVVADILDIIAQVITAVAGIITYLTKTFKPLLEKVFPILLDLVDAVVSSIGDYIESMLTVISGIIDFLTGIFSGDWKKAWRGIKNIFRGMANLIIATAEGMVNLVITGFNALLTAIIGGIESLINAALGAVEWLADAVGLDVNIPRVNKVPQIPKVKLPRLDTKMATGGVVDSPTTALIGEGRYPEAVVPLGNSPQLAEMLQRFADIVETRKDDDSVPVQVVMNLDGEVIYKNQQRVSRKRGISFEMGDFER